MTYMGNQGLLAGFRDYIARLTEERRYSTAKSYRDALNSFMRFHGREEAFIPYTFLTRETLRRYESYLSALGRSRNTISTYMRRLRCVYHLAVDAGEVPLIPRLFKDVFTGVECGRKRALKAEEQRRLLEVSVEDPELRRSQVAAGLMLHLGGMPFVDLAHLTAGQVKEGELHYHRQKTGTLIRLRLLERAHPLLSELTGGMPPGSRYLLPLLEGELEGYAAWRAYRSALTRMNRHLERIRRLAGIESKVTTYTIRHTFATSLKEVGVSVEMIAELLGHRSIRTTQTYLRDFSLDRQTEARRACLEAIYACDDRVAV